MDHLNKNDFVKAVKFIYDNLDKEISLEEIAKFTTLSISSLKRLFLKAVNQSPGHFIRRLKMEYAFKSLKKEKAVLDVALDIGFEDHSAFARSFKKYFGYSPTCARKKINPASEFDNISLNEPEITELNEINIQSVSKQGVYFESAPSAWKALKKCLSDDELNDDFTGTFIGIGHDNPHDEKVSIDQMCFSAGITFCTRDLHLEKKILDTGTYAKFTFSGKINNVGLAYHYIYGPWSEKTNVKINLQLPSFMVLDTFPDSFNEQNIAIYVPLIP